MARHLIVPGSEIDSDSTDRKFVKSEFHKPVAARAVEVSATRDGAKEIVLEEDGVAADRLVELQLDDGSVVLTNASRLREMIRDAAAVRGEGDLDRVPTFFDFGAAERGFGGVALKVLRWFKVDPVKELADVATLEAIRYIEDRLDRPPGLYRLRDDGSLGEPIGDALPAAAAPLLLFLHGTASSTSGSFSALFAGTSEWRALQAKYKDRIFAFEHRTLSESPVANALALAELLPSGAELHLVSHSRGGLVGELLCRAPLTDEELETFAAHRDLPERHLEAELDNLRRLSKELETKEFRVERFVRVACPAAGTLLASDRLDLYLSLLLKTIGLAMSSQPALEAIHEFVSSLLLEVARRRTDARELPGLEAQRPESPFIRLLNREGSKVDHDLSVIAGDLHRGNLLQTLRALLGYSYFLEKNDLVVDTRAMYRGLRRSTAWVSYHETAEVTHFSYFREAPSRERLAAALLRDDKSAQPAGFAPLEADFAQRSFSVLRDEAAEKEATLLFLPDFLGSRLETENGQQVWLSAQSLAAGAIGKLVPQAQHLRAVGLVDESGLAALDEATRGTTKIFAVAYDWRLGAAEASASLEQRLAGLEETAPRPVHLVAHGLGALGVLGWIADHPAQWSGMVKLGSRAVLVGAPLAGSQTALQMVAGGSRFVHLLSMLDPARRARDLSRLFLHWPGLVDLLPDQALRDDWWERWGGDSPSRVLLSAAALRRRSQQAVAASEGVHYLFGLAEQTPVGEIDERDELVWRQGAGGDGWMLNPDGLSPATRSHVVSGLHQRLMLDPEPVQVVADLAMHGNTKAASPPKPAAKQPPPPPIFPNQRDLLEELSADGDRNDRQKKTLVVRVAHGSLDRVRDMPVAAGHYDRDDSLHGAEKFLNRCLEGRLQQHLDLGLYPGPAGSALWIPAPNSKPRGALIIGLGDVGGISGQTLAKGVETGILQMAVAEASAARRGEAASGGAAGGEASQASLACLLIGTGGGGTLTFRQSMAAVIRGVLSANRKLEGRNPGQGLRLTDLTFVELWSDIAIAAGRALRDLDDDVSIGRLDDEELVIEERLQLLEGRRGNSATYGTNWNWWRRIIMTEDELVGSVEVEGTKAPAKRVSMRGIKFVSLTERARAEETFVLDHGRLVDLLMEKAPGSISDIGDGSVVNALFELLLPVSIKERLFEEDSLVLVVDRGAGQYPWELLARRRRGEVEPVVSRIKVIRQFKTANYRSAVVHSRGRHALVLGDPVEVKPRLEASLTECRDVADLLAGASPRYEVCRSETDTAVQIIQKLFFEEYRIVHIAAHGFYNAERPEQSGVVIGDGAVLSAAVFKQLRTVPEVVFLNCCHLGRLDVHLEEPKRFATTHLESGRLAVSVAEALIELGVRCVVVAGWAINDRAARDFASVFYRRLLRGERFGDAVHAGRIEVYRKYRHTTTWGAYQAYGDPNFYLRGTLKTARRSSAPRFVSQEEAHGKVEDIVAAASGLGRSEAETESLRSWLESVESALEPGWTGSGALLSTRAEAWASLGSKTKAIELYREALRSKDGSASLKAAEQLANLIGRLRWAEDAERTDIEALDQSKLRPFGADQRRKAEDLWLDWVEKAGESAERHGLRGGVLKRRALNALEKGYQRAETRLAAAAEAYRKGFERGLTESGEQVYFNGPNAVALAWAAGGTTPTVKQHREVLHASLEAAKADQKKGETFQNSVAVPDIELLKLLVEKRLDDSAIESLLGQYEECLQRGDRGDHDSVFRQLDFLRRAATRRGQAQDASRLQTLLDQLKTREND